LSLQSKTEKQIWNKVLLIFSASERNLICFDFGKIELCATSPPPTLVIFMRLKPYFKVCALIFYVCEGSSQAIANQLNMQNIVVSIFFDYERHDL